MLITLLTIHFVLCIYAEIQVLTGMKTSFRPENQVPEQSTRKKKGKKAWQTTKLLHLFTFLTRYVRCEDFIYIDCILCCNGVKVWLN